MQALGNGETFEHVWNREREQQWEWGSVRSHLYPLAHVDDIGDVLERDANARALAVRLRRQRRVAGVAESAADTKASQERAARRAALSPAARRRRARIAHLIKRAAILERTRRQVEEASVGDSNAEHSGPGSRRHVTVLSLVAHSEQSEHILVLPRMVQVCTCVSSGR